MHTLDAWFGSGPPIGVWQACARAALIFAFGLLIVRIAGRRIFGRWSALDIVVSIVIGSNLSRALTGNAPLWSTLLASAVLVLLHWIAAHLAARSRWLSRLVEGPAVILGRDGQVDRGTQQRWAVSVADLDQALRSAGLRDLKEAHLLVLEANGKINVLNGPAAAPLVGADESDPEPSRA